MATCWSHSHIQYSISMWACVCSDCKRATHITMHSDDEATLWIVTCSITCRVHTHAHTNDIKLMQTKILKLCSSHGLNVSQISHPGWLVDPLVFNGTFSTNSLYCAVGVWNISYRAGEQDKHTMKQWYFGLGSVEIITSSQIGFLRTNCSSIVVMSSATISGFCLTSPFRRSPQVRSRSTSNHVWVLPAPDAVNNNNNNNHDDIYSAVIMTAKSLREFTRIIWWMQNSAKRPPTLRPETKPPDLGGESACFRQLSSTTTISIYYYSARKLILIYRPTEGRRLSWPRHCRKGAHCFQGCKSQWLLQ